MKSVTAADKNTIALAALRIAVGCLFLIFAQYKVFGSQFTLHGGFQWWINQFLRQGAYPFIGPGAADICTATWDDNRILSSLRRTGDWIGARNGLLCKGSQRLRFCLHDGASFFFQLSWAQRAPLAILRSIP